MAKPLPPPSPIRPTNSSIRATPSKTSQTSRYSTVPASPMSKQTPIKNYVRTEKPVHPKICASPRSTLSSRASQTPVTSSYAQSKMTPSRYSVTTTPRHTLSKVTTPSRTGVATPASRTGATTPASQSLAKVTRSLYGPSTQQTRTPMIAKPLNGNQTLETPLKTPLFGAKFTTGHRPLETPLKTPLIVGKPPLGDRNTAGSKLQSLRQGPILRSKMSMSAQHAKPIQVKYCSNMFNFE